MKTVSLFNRLAIAALMVVGFAMPVNAIMIDVAGVWSNPTGTAANVNGVGTSQISWGNPTSAQSSYQFLGNTGVSIADGSIDGSTFDLGTFVHNNNPIRNGNFLSVELDVTLEIEQDNMVSIVDKTFNFLFGHDETPNRNPCNPVGSTICPDVVSIPTTTSSESVEIFGQTYSLDIIGFLVGGSVVSEFVTEERMSNRATLQASLNRVDVSEPGTIALFAAGLLGLGYMRRAKKA